MNVNIQAFPFLFRSVLFAIGFGLIAYSLYPQLVTAESPLGILPFSLALGGAVLLSSLLHWLLFRLSQRSTTVYVGNLAFKTTENELYELFSQFGAIQSIRIMKDRITRRPRGYAFVELNVAGAKAAIKALNGNEFAGRTLKVNVANQRGRRQD